MILRTVRMNFSNELRSVRFLLFKKYSKCCWSDKVQWFHPGSAKAEIHTGHAMVNKLEDSGGKGMAETLFNLYKNYDTNMINMGKLVSAIEKTGIRRSDPRLSNMLHKISKYKALHGVSLNNLNVDINTFYDLTNEHLVLVNQIAKQDVVIPDWASFNEQITEMFNKCKTNQGGEVASYIPQLAAYDPDLWGMSICTIDGQRFSLGDVNTKFTIQSCSKPFTYAICLSELGNEGVHKYIGQEPSGRNFNDLSLDPSNKPHNPMLNAGAIMSSALILQNILPREGVAEKYEFLLKYMTRMAGNEVIGFNNSVFLSERENANRNFAMAYYMQENKCFPEGTDIHDCLDLYFQSCSLEVTSESLSVLGATLANGGICPITGENVLNPCAVRDTLSLMYSCGMYNYSGQFAFKVGLPAKSGVSGCVLLVIPNVMAISLWSPPIDSIGNSVRALQFCEELVNVYSFHRFETLNNLVTQKIDPRRQSYEEKTHGSLTLFFAAITGDVSSLNRYVKTVFLKLIIHH